MSLWQRRMISLARSEPVKRLMQRIGGASALAGRFVVVGDPETAVVRARQLHDRLGISASLFYLGEYVSDPALVDRSVETTITAARLLGAGGLDVQVSVDPTAIGHLASPAVCRESAQRIARAVAAQPAVARSFLMLDMEDLALVEPTLRLHRDLHAQGLPVAVTLQARLRRTARDLAALVRQPTAIRLVKGAFPLGPEHDHQGKGAIDRSYLSLARTMLAPEAREAGLRPVFATHDDRLIRRIAALATEMGWQKQEYEFEMLYGVRRGWQRRLRAEGFSVRLYLPFGSDWWPYAVRRVGEHPGNALLVARTLVSGERFHSAPSR